MNTKPKPASTRPRPPLGATPMRALTVKQVEERHPGAQGRVRGWIHRADANDAAFAWLRPAIIRIGRSVLIDELRFVEGLRQRSEIKPAPDRRHGARGGSSCGEDEA